MSSYYSNIIQSGQLTGTGGTGGQDALFHPDSKYDATKYDSYFNNPASQNGRYDSGPGGGGGGGGGGGDAVGQHAAFPRYPPFDRIDPMNPVATLANKQATGGFMSTTVASSSPYSTATGLANYTLPTPHAYADELNGCKLPQADPGTMANSLQSSASQGAHPATAAAAAAMMSPFNHSNPIQGMVNSMHSQPQNIPIYPWMRPMNGG